MWIGANEALGRHRSVLEDLLDLRRDGGDPFVHARVMKALVRIGDLEGLRREADLALDRGGLDPRHALNVAYALRAAAPTTARRALAIASELPPPDGAFGTFAALAAELGLTELHERLFTAMLADPEAGRHVLRIDDVEQAVAQFRRTSDDHRDRFISGLRLGLHLAWVPERYGSVPALRKATAQLFDSGAWPGIASILAASEPHLLEGLEPACVERVPRRTPRKAVLELLTRPEGATLKEIAARTGQRAAAIRAALSRLGSIGLETKTAWRLDRQRCWHVVPTASPKRRASQNKLRSTGEALAAVDCGSA